MQITSLNIVDNIMNLTITDAASVISLRLWDKDTYKDFTKLIDLSSKLTGADTENITIFTSDLNIEMFDGVYFIEAEDVTETSIEFTSQLNKYKECILLRSLKVDACVNCINEKDVILTNLNTIFKSLEFALDLRFIDDILLNIKTLDKYCVNDCQSCGSNIEDISSFENSNPDTINIIVDGGSLD